MSFEKTAELAKAPPSQKPPNVSGFPKPCFCWPVSLCHLILPERKSVVIDRVFVNDRRIFKDRRVDVVQIPFRRGNRKSGGRLEPQGAPTDRSVQNRSNGAAIAIGEGNSIIVDFYRGGSVESILRRCSLDRCENKFTAARIPLPF